MSFNILNRYSGAVLFASASANDIAGAVADAMKSRANLSRADLSSANLSSANLSSANLSSANLYGANLSRANLSRANLSSANLYGANLSRADLSSANLSSADLSSANLYGANLSRADLSSANLSSANLSSANLYGANLSRADLSSANLYGAKGVSAYASTPLIMLLDQPGKIRAYKLVTAEGYGPFKGGVYYEVGLYLEEPGADTDATEHCAAGINVATLDWCIREWREGYRILVVEFTAADIAAIPLATDGKFRLFRCAVVAEKNLAEIGVGVKADETEAAV